MSRFALPLLVAVVLPGFAEDAPLPPAEAPKRMTLPDGFRATLFAGEPDVVQPIAFTFDDRGRLWVVECHSYPNWKKDGTGNDRILIFEDADGDGRFDRRKVFFDKGSNLSGIQFGFGGVWLCATPTLQFIPDRNGDDVPDGPPEVLLDGWDLNAKHNVFAALNWGPDGWLYGCNGILSNSKVGKPGTPDDQRVPINCGVWRYHPTRHVFEAVAHGTTNPWGLDFNEYGQMFITNCVIHHLWHVVPGAHFQRMYGQDFNPHLYGLMESCADHIHWAGGPWQSSRGGKGEHDNPGGGHAHVGAMIYLGDNWPDEYRGDLYTCNVHGNRVNHDILKPRGSGYVAHHGKDFLLANDTWFRGLAIAYGPDGGVYVADWTDTGECHNYEIADRTNGRIYKVTHGKVTPVRHLDLAKLGDAELVQLHLHKNDWQTQHARRLLHERAAAGKLTGAARTGLLKILQDHPDVTRKLRALWTLHGVGSVDERLVAALLGSPHEYVRSWAVQLQLENRSASPAMLANFARMAATDESPVVRLVLASGLQRLPLEHRWAIAEGLVSHSEDARDASLPLMIWYGVEPLVTENVVRSLRDRTRESRSDSPTKSDSPAERIVPLLLNTRVPLVREYIARRSADSPEPLVRVLEKADDPALQLDVLKGVHEALLGLRQVKMPAGWPAAYRKLNQSTNADVRERATLLSLVFGDPQALATLRTVMQDAAAPAAARQNAVQALVQKKDPALPPLLQGLLTDRAVRGAAVRGLAAYGDAATPEIILRQYASFNDAEKADAIGTLTSRPAYALALLDAMERDRVPRRDLSAFTVRQLAAFGDKQINEKLNNVWGAIRPTARDKTALAAQYKTLLTPEFMKKADRGNGRLVFSRNCAACHVLFGEGGKIGPELTGGQRANLDYVLENLLDPSAVVGRDFQVTVIETKDGRVLTGIVKREDEKTVTIQSPTEIVVLPTDELEQRTRSPVSIMPEGNLARLSNEEIRDLIAYLASPAQVPLR